MEKQYRNVGSLNKPNEKGVMKGGLRSFDLDIDLQVWPVLTQQSTDHPSHEVMAMTPKGNPFAVGSAWLKSREGKQTLSIKFDAEGLPEWAYEGIGGVSVSGGGFRLIRTIEPERQTAEAA